MRPPMSDACEFASAPLVWRLTKAQKTWHQVDVTDAFSTWLSSHPYRETYFRQPEMLSAAALKDFERSLIAQVVEALGPAAGDPNDRRGSRGRRGAFSFHQGERLYREARAQDRRTIGHLLPGRTRWLQLQAARSQRRLELPGHADHRYRGKVMTLNADLFVEDPTKKSIPNLGVAKVGEPTDQAGWDVLRYELQALCATARTSRASTASCRRTSRRLVPRSRPPG